MFSPEVKVEESLAMKQELLGELFLEESKLRFTKSRNNSDSDSKQLEHLIVAQQRPEQRGLRRTPDRAFAQGQLLAPLRRKAIR